MKPLEGDVHESSMGIPKSAFLDDCVKVQLSNLVALKKLGAAEKESGKFLQVVASIREVGLIEPPAVLPIPNREGWYFVVDGLLRIEALKELNVKAVDCMIATDDDTYTYNKHVNRLSIIQEHKMIVKALDRGVSAERLAKALGLSTDTIRQRFVLLNGICDEAVAHLANKPCPAKIFQMLRQMRPLRQLEAAELMIGQNNFSVSFATAILAATPADQLSPKGRVRGRSSISSDAIAMMERELATLHVQTRTVEDSYGPDVLHLTVIKGYLASLLSRASIVRWLAQYQPDYLREFQRITEMENLLSPGRGTLTTPTKALGPKTRNIPIVPTGSPQAQ